MPSRRDTSCTNTLRRYSARLCPFLSYSATARSRRRALDNRIDDQRPTVPPCARAAHRTCDAPFSSCRHPRFAAATAWFFSRRQIRGIARILIQTGQPFETQRPELSDHLPSIVESLDLRCFGSQKRELGHVAGLQYSCQKTRACFYTQTCNLLILLTCSEIREPV